MRIIQNNLWNLKCIFDIMEHLKQQNIIIQFSEQECQLFHR